jgi:hypothetical protein
MDWESYLVITLLIYIFVIYVVRKIWQSSGNSDISLNAGRDIKESEITLKLIQVKVDLKLVFFLSISLVYIIVCGYLYSYKNYFNSHENIITTAKINIGDRELYVTKELGSYIMYSDHDSIEFFRYYRFDCLNGHHQPYSSRLLYKLGNIEFLWHPCSSCGKFVGENFQEIYLDVKGAKTSLILFLFKKIGIGINDDVYFYEKEKTTNGTATIYGGQPSVSFSIDEVQKALKKIE